MKRIVLLLIFLPSFFCAFAQQVALTDTGLEVILYEDGTWEYKDSEEAEATEIPVNKKKITKHDDASFLLKSNSFDVGFWINPKEWTFKKSTDNPEAEYELQLKSGDLYGMIISEKIEIPLESLKMIAVENGRSVAPDLKIVKEEYRTVNGLKVLLLQMDGTTQGIKFSYYGYYYSNENGTVQFITYTSQNLMNKSIKTCEKLLNGLVEL